MASKEYEITPISVLTKQVDTLVVSGNIQFGSDTFTMTAGCKKSNPDKSGPMGLNQNIYTHPEPIILKKEDFTNLNEDEIAAAVAAVVGVVLKKK